MRFKYEDLKQVKLVPKQTWVCFLGQLNVVPRWHLVSPCKSLWDKLTFSWGDIWCRPTLPFETTWSCFKHWLGLSLGKPQKRLKVVSRMTLCNWAMNHIEAMGIKGLDFKQFAFKLCPSWALMDVDLVSKSGLDGSKKLHANLCVMECANI